MSPCNNETYFVTVTDINGCQNSDEINVILIPDISYSSGFSPNNDGVMTLGQLTN